MASRFEVEVTLMSGKDLKNINWRYGPIRPYAVVWVDPQLKCSTRVDEEGDTCPRWNEKLVISLDRPIDDDSTLCFDIVHSKSPDEDVKPLIGSAKLKLHEFVDVDGIGSKSLRLKRPSGRPHGKIEVKISVSNPRYRTPDPLVAPYGVGGGDYAAPPTTYDAPTHAYGAPTPAYGAPTPEYGAPTPAYGAPTPAYGAPTPAYGAPTPAYGAPTAEYGAPTPAYGAPTPVHGAPTPEYGAPTPAYGAPTPAYGAPTPAYGAPAPAYGAPTPAYGAPQPQHGYSGAPTYGTSPAYGAAPTYGAAPAYGAAPIYKQEERKKSMFGGMGKGLAIGAVAGALGGLVFAEGLDKFEDHIAHKAADRVEEDLAEDDEW